MQGKLLDMMDKSNALWTLYLRNGPHVANVLAKIGYSFAKLGKESMSSNTSSTERCKSKSRYLEVKKVVNAIQEALRRKDYATIFQRQTGKEYFPEVLCAADSDGERMARLRSSTSPVLMPGLLVPVGVLKEAPRGSYAQSIEGGQCWRRR